MKRAIYVDYENVSLGGLKEIESLTSDDLVKIFIGSQSSKLSMVEADRIFNCEASVELITNKFIGKNALDFIIMVHMGHDIAQSLAKEYYIISKDKGYDPAIHEMRRLSGLSVKRCDDISATMNKKSVGAKIKGFFKSVKSTETPDTTEHLVVGKKHNSSLHIGKKNDKIEGNSGEPVKEAAAEKKQEIPKKKPEVRKQEMSKKQPEARKQEAKPEVKPAARAEVKSAAKAEVKAETAKPETAKPETAKPETAKPETKADTTASDNGSEEKKTSNNRNRRRRNHKKHESTSVEQKTVGKAEEPDKSEATATETAKPVVKEKPAEETPKSNNRNHRRRGHGNNNKPKVNEMVSEQKAENTNPPKTKEDEERERQRAEAFALLRELHEEDN